MAKIALKDATISDTTASNHIIYKVLEQVDTGGGYYDQWGDYVPTYPINDWVQYPTSATVKGKAVSTVSNVTIEGKAPIVQGDKTTENDSYSLPSGGVYVSGSHTNAQGSVTVGNSNNVFINGKSVATDNSTVTTHAGTSSKINGGASSTVTIGS
ncbi:hypothetical protein SAMN06295926_10525 [Lysinibacillus sp. AC-3]|uniref:hypothetical protein n=1 Tax=unclassified Lysinibacillus TaxID=2636778 RepID=UPI0009D5C5CE|nr:MULTISPECIES: hypothetical protein [unclassified Lysinibacillus]SKB63833.1 hypothetical protein SAMN06295926_10525 [Lysinibacillus sp. AC-3]